MRLTPDEVTAIKTAAAETFGADVVVRLFGSRVHDHLKGGDIDLHFEVTSSAPDSGLRSTFLDAIERATDARKIDTVFSVFGRQPRGIERVAYRDGIVL